MNNARKNFVEVITKKCVKQIFQGGFIFIIIVKTFFLDFISMPESGESSGKSTELFDISTIVMGKGMS